MPLSMEEIGDGAVMYQDASFHKLGTDSVLLSQFAPVKKNQNLCDLGAGQGALSLLLLLREPTLKIHGVEILPRAAEICLLNMERNGFRDNFTMHVGDMRIVRPEIQGHFDIVVSNPPYFKCGSGKKCASKNRQACRCDENCTAEELCRTAGQIVKFGGVFSVVYRADRCCDMLCAMRDCSLEPKVMRFVHKDCLSPPSLVLITAKRGAASGIKVMPPLLTAQR